MITFGSLFAGIGGFDLGFERAGMQCAWQVEIDPYCQQVLAKHWPDVPRFGDVRDVGKHNLPAVDLVCAGVPCQDVSLAGKRQGLKGKRTTLWSECARITGELRPRWLVVENVPGLLSSDDGRFFGNILRDLAQIRYDAEWDCFPAAAFGAPHRRDRVFLLAYPQSIAGNGCASHGIWGGARLGAERKPRGRDFDVLPPTSDWALHQPPICGENDGVSSWLDRHKSLGNAVVPQVAEWIGRRIVEVDRAC